MCTCNTYKYLTTFAAGCVSGQLLRRSRLPAATIRNGHSLVGLARWYEASCEHLGPRAGQPTCTHARLLWLAALLAGKFSHNNVYTGHDPYPCEGSYYPYNIKDLPLPLDNPQQLACSEFQGCSSFGGDGTEYTGDNGFTVVDPNHPDSTWSAPSQMANVGNTQSLTWGDGTNEMGTIPGVFGCEQGPPCDCDCDSPFNQ